MAHFPYTRPAGVWVSLSDLDATEMADFDAKVFKAINGDEGGTWAPSTPITIGGSGVEVTGVAHFSGVVTISAHLAALASARFGESNPLDLFRVSCLAQFDEQVELLKSLTVAGNFFTTGSVALLQSNATITGTLAVHQKLKAKLGLDITGGLLACDAPAQFDDNTVIGLTSGNTSYFNASVTFAAPVTLSGAGHIRKRLVTGANADTTYNVSTVDVVRVPTGVLSANRVYTIGTTGAAAGSTMKFIMEDEVNNISVRRLDTTQIGNILRKNQPGNNDWMEIIYTGTAWQPLSFGQWP